MPGLVDKKLNGASNTGSDIDDFFNDLIDFLITAFDILAGVVTFTNHPITPSSAPTTDYQVANKKYVDDQASLGAKVSKTVDTPYLADTDGVVTIVTDAGGIGGQAYFYTDENDPPTTLWGNANMSAGQGMTITCFVNKGEYYKATVSGTATLTSYYFKPRGT